MRGSPITARRLRRPSWRDPRLLLGLVLVLASTVGGALLLARADDTVPVYAAAEDVVAGQPLSTATMTVVRVRVADVEDHFILAGTAFDADDVALRTVAAGDLFPRWIVGSRADQALRPVSVPLGGPEPEGLRRGSLVDVWIARRSAAQVFEAPRKVAANAEVFSVAEDSAGLGAISGTAVEILLDDAGVSGVLGSLANGDRVDVVVVPGSAPGS